MNLGRLRFGLIFSIATLAVGAFSQPADPNLLGGLKWRLLGPFRGGRALAVTGSPDNPEKFYFGAVGGGVWKTKNAGRTWKPIFDQEPAASIGAIAVAPTNPNVIYVGSGEADMRSDIQQGDGMYRSRDGGVTWTHIGLEDSRQIGKILVDPRDSNTLYVAALGHQYGPNDVRGVYKSVDGGDTWAKMLWKDQDTGAIDLAMDPSRPNEIFAAMWQTRRPPWSIYPPSNGPGTALYKSENAGLSWTQVSGGGFPKQVGRMSVSISPAQPRRVFACLDSADPQAGGVYRSDDGGATWTHSSGDPRIWGRGWYFTGITADPKNPDEVYVMNTSAYRSVDGGKTFVAFKGAPGGDDYHTCWIAPENPNRMIIGSDQGTVISVDGGMTWSSWYNQPTGQFYHVVTDNRFPYWVYGSQQDSGAMAMPSRTIHTGISSLYQRPIDAGGESGTIAPDPLQPGLLYSSSGSKENLETGWEKSIDPTLLFQGETWRNEWTMPIVVSPADPHAIYTSHQKIFKSSDGGGSWKIVSPDLTRPRTPNLPNLDAVTSADNDGTIRRGVVYWIAPSPLKADLIWAGTDDGLIWQTSDGGTHWENVTPPDLTPWSKVGIIDASHFNPNTAYAAIDRHRLDDNRPYIYRTKDRGKSWLLITDGLPRNQFVNVVREDPRRPGLLYAGTDLGVYVSFDEGANWQSLQLNLPPASIRDIVFGDGDVVAGTHGRAVWVLDDPSVLRQVVGGAGIADSLFNPDPALMFQRAGTFGFGLYDEGTPLPPEEPQGENPPWGAILDYSLKRGGTPVTLTITDSDGKLIRKISSTDPVRKIDPSKLDIPAYWVHPSVGLESGEGAHRYLWDFGYLRQGGPRVPPGTYKVVMSTDGKTYARSLTVLRDPRLSATNEDLREQFRLALGILDRLATLERSLQATSDKELQVKMRRVADELRGLEGVVESAPSAPSKQCEMKYVLLSAAVDGFSNRLPPGKKP
jgi:photosystem II stability/assembly factor-like uncharacterized protein